FSATTADVPKVAGDIKLLNAALTAQYPPSVELDKQFPIEAAREYFDVTLQPVGQCIRDTRSVLWVGYTPSETPLAALLTEGTRGELEKKPLSEWPWAIKSFDTAYVETLATLAALRKRRVPRELEAEREFAGVGDPIFSGATPDGDDRARLVL